MLTVTRPQVPEAIRNLATNAWNWDYRRFLKEAGLDDGPSAREAWTHFRQAADHLARLDAERLAAVCRKSL